MIIIKLLFLFISIGVSAFCIVKINGLPDKELSFKKNDKKITFYICIGGIVDFILIMLAGGIASSIASPIVVDECATVIIIILSAIYFCITIVTTRKLRRRIREYVNDKKFYYDISELNKSAYIKMIFFMIEIGWLRG